MRKVKVSAVQMKCTTDVWENIANAEKFVRQAKEDGANIVLLPELFERQYFCQERRYDYYNFAKPTLENDAVKHFAKLAKELEIVIPVSFYERDGNRLFNSAAVIDADGEILGVYRKPTFPMTIIIRKSSTLSPVIQALKPLRQGMAQLAWVFAGISGFLKPQEPSH